MYLWVMIYLVLHSLRQMLNDIHHGSFVLKTTNGKCQGCLIHYLNSLYKHLD